MDTLAGQSAKRFTSACQQRACRFRFLFLGITAFLLLAPALAWPQQNDFPRILPRAGTSEQMLPADSVLLERELTAWEEHRWWILGALAVVGAQVGLISLLAVAQFRKSRAQRELVKEIELEVGMLRESEERFRLVADSAPVMIWMAGPDRLCNYFNRFWLDFRGRSLEQEKGDGWMDGIHPDDLARCIRRYNESFDSRRLFTMEYRMSRADGDFRWVLETGVPRNLPGGGFAGFIGACVDITEQKESDHARAQLSGLLITAQEKERASIARELHDHVNQRLALLAIELQQFEATVNGLSDEDRDELERLWNLINEISHDVQSLSHQLHSSQLQHLGLVAGIRSLCLEFSKSNEIEAECRCAGHIPGIDENVSLALFRVTQEALRNVSKYSRARLVQADLHCEHDVLTLRVTDDGVGFDPTTVDGGGLGLISMRERMRLVGGELNIHSRPGGGTRIEARIPLVRGAPEKIPPDVPAQVERRKHVRA